jgi:hypothetical protein
LDDPLCSLDRDFLVYTNFAKMIQKNKVGKICVYKEVSISLLGERRGSSNF